MAWLSRDDIKNIVEECLEEKVADWNGESEQFQIVSIPDQHIVGFINCIQQKMNDRGYRILLAHDDNPDTGVRSFEKIGDLIDYIKNRQSELPS